MDKRDVLVGVPQDKTARKGDPITNASLAYIHDQGAPEANIPARPFMKPGITNAQTKITNQMQLAAKKSIDGDASAIEQGLLKVGMVAQSSIRAIIQAGEGFAALTAGTLNARKKRGRTGVKPLLDTGQLRNSINFTIRGK